MLEAQGSFQQIATRPAEVVVSYMIHLVPVDGSLWGKVFL